MNRLHLMKIHALLASFILPVAVMFMLTGSLYTWGIKGGYSSEIYDIQLATGLKPKLIELVDVAQLELKRLGIDSPEGKPKLKTFGTHFLLEWTGSSKDVILEPAGPVAAKLKVKNTSWYRNLVQLHKAKGGSAFKIYAVLFSIAMGLILISGFLMAWQTPKLKPITLITSFMGAISFVAIVLIS